MLFFCLFQCFEETEYQTESKWNETFGNVIFSLDKIQETWTLGHERREAATRVEGAPLGAPLPRGPPDAPPTYSFLLYIPTYPRTIRRGDKNLIPQPQLSVSTRSHLGACSGAPPEGALSHPAFCNISFALIKHKNLDQQKLLHYLAFYVGVGFLSVNFSSAL